MIQFKKLENVLTKIKTFILKVFNIKVIPYILVLFFVTPVEILNVKPFAYVMLVCATIFKIPLLFPLLISSISFMVFKNPSNIIVNYLIIYSFYTILVSIIDVKGINEKLIAFIKFIISMIVAFILIAIFKGFEYDEFIKQVTMLLIITTTYPVFLSGMSLILNINKNLIFSTEEIISAIAIITIAILPFAIFKIYDISIVSIILMTFIVMVSWINDFRVGCTVAILISLIYLIYTKDNPFILTTYIFSALIVGTFNKSNKWVIIFLFSLGNFLILSFILSDYLLYMKIIEIIIVALIIFKLPKRLLLKLNDLFYDGSGLSEGYNNILGPGSTINKSGSISEIFDNIIDYDIPVTKETIDETFEVVKKYLYEYTQKNCLDCTNIKICEKSLDEVSKKIAISLEEGHAIKQEVFENRCVKKEEIISNIQNIYANIKLMRIIKEKEIKTNQKYTEEYINVSKAIDNITNIDSLQDIVTKEQKEIRDELKFLGYIVYKDVFIKQNGNIYYEIITDIIIDRSKAKKEILNTVNQILDYEMYIDSFVNISKTENSRIILKSKNEYNIETELYQKNAQGNDRKNQMSFVYKFIENDYKNILAFVTVKVLNSKTNIKTKELINPINKMFEKNKNKKEEEIIKNIVNYIKGVNNVNIRIKLDICIVDKIKNNFKIIKLNSEDTFLFKDNSLEIINNENIKTKIMEDSDFYSYDISLKKGMFFVLVSDKVKFGLKDKDLIEFSKTKIYNMSTLQLLDKIIYMSNNNQKEINESSIFLIGLV